KDRAASLQQALKHLADTSERNAGIQEKLGRLQQERDSRLGLGERFATADAGERARLNRGLALAGRAAAGGPGLDGLPLEDRKLVLDVLRSAGTTTLTGFKGAPRADDLYKSLLSKYAGGTFDLNAGQKAEEGQLRKDAQANNATGEKSIEELIKHQ